ncbi:MAG: RHS repeat protein [Verrucomicrobia bacterium]|nr:RHS repeat protein [Verrucomicrobiota bacterium]
MIRKLCAFLILATALSAHEKRVLADPFVHFVTEGEPGYKICDAVSAITGYVVTQDDLVIAGAEPIRIPRLYISGESKTSDYAGWTFFPHLKLYKYKKVWGYKAKGHKKYYVPEPSGAMIAYTRVDKHNFKINMERHGFSITNTAGPYISGRSNLANNVLTKKNKKWVSLYPSEGGERAYELKDRESHEGKRFYSTYLLQWERLPNGNHVHYGYDKHNRVNSISTTNPNHKKTYAWAKISYFGERNFKIEASDGRVLHYHFGKRDNAHPLDHIDKNFSFTEHFAYSTKHEHPNPYLSQVSVPLGRFWKAEYYQIGSNDVNGTYVHIEDNNFRRRRVKKLFAPMGRDSSPVQTHSFLYNDNKKKKRGFSWPPVTHIYDVYGHHIEVISTEGLRPQSTTWYVGKDQIYCSEKTVWSGHLLKRKIFCDEKGDPIQQREFTYDDWGNVLEESFCQNITKYQYNDERLMARKEESSGLITQFSYLKGTDLLAARTTTDRQKIFIRELFEYDEDHILVRIIKEADGRRWLKRIQPGPTGLAASIEECYYDEGQEKLLSRREFTYSPLGKVTEERVFDADRKLAYVLYKKYNPMGQVTEETDALGQITRHTYDELGNEIATLEPSGLYKEMVYDYANRLIQLTESGSHEKRTTSFAYDLKGRKISSTDTYGNTTHFTYDPFDHLTSTHHPDGAQEGAVYDCMGRKTQIIDGCGSATSYQYNPQGKPTQILHSDGTLEKFSYDVSGRLLTSTDAVGAEVHYTYDAMGRPLTKTTFSPGGEKLSQESWVYDSLHLLSQTDASGHTTTYQYDGAGRKIAENETLFAYDSLGRLSKTTCGDRETQVLFDLLDRPVEERVGDLYLVQYAYDAAGNKTEVVQAGGCVSTLYDAFNRPIQIIDARGYATYIEYDPLFPRKTTTTPDGVQTIETYDSRVRLSIAEKISPFGELLSREKYTYDGNGSLILQESSVIWQGKVEEEIATAWEYGPGNHLLSITQALGTPNQRITRYTYTATGLRATLLKPSGTSLHYSYDFLGRLTHLYSSDSSCHYEYIYDKGPSPIQIDDLTHKTSTHLRYDHKNRLIEERLATGLTFSWTYDALGRKTSLTLPDHSHILYKYDPMYLRRIERYDRGGTLLYAHSYTAFDTSGHLLEEELIGRLGPKHFTLGTDGAPLKSSSPYHQEALVRSATSQITQWQKDGRENSFTYDHLGQLTSEQGQRYGMDSLGRRRIKNQRRFIFNALHQTDGVYDLDGRLTSHNAVDYSYDALDRLIRVATKDTIDSYTYDPFHRRLSQTTNGETLRFLYDHQDEIGSIDAENKLIQFRVLGLGLGAEIGAAISLELDGEIYAPIHDFQGNISKLITLSGKVAFTYDYTAFGEPKGSYYTHCPWRFASKRTDDETGLVFFGRRYYDPTLGRWLTPDPEGFTDSTNLYLFVHNDPLMSHDLYGLFDYGPNYVRFSFEEVGAGFRALKFGLGYALSALGKFVIPNMLGGRTITGLGNTIAGSGAYKSQQPYTYHIVGHRDQTNNQGTYINGANTSFNEAQKSATRFSDSFKVPVTLVYNPTDGIFSDLVECILNQFGVRTAAVDLLAQTWRHILSDYRRMNHSGMIPHGAHSQGGIITKLALEMLSPGERSIIEVHTYGSASLFSGRLAGGVKHHVSVRDGIPFFSIFRLAKSISRHLRGKDSNVFFIGSWWGCPLTDHSIMNETYDTAMREGGREFLINHGKAI